jgi:hypothetical protein
MQQPLYRQTTRENLIDGVTADEPIIDSNTPRILEWSHS